MYIEDVLETLDLTRIELAALLGCSNQNLQHWVTNNEGLIPRGHACYLQVLTEGKLLVDLSLYE